MKVDSALSEIVFLPVEPEDECLEAWATSFLIGNEMYILSLALFEDEYGIAEMEVMTGLPPGDGKGYLVKF